MDQGEQGSTKNEADAAGDGRAREPETQRAADPPIAGEKAAPERVDWTAILEERALVPDSESASPVAVAEVPLEIPRRRGLLHLVVAVVALFSVVASAAVVMALWRGGSEDEKSGPAAKSTPPPAPGASAAAAESPPAPMPPRETPPAPAPAVVPDDEPREDPPEPREETTPRDEKKAESRSKKSRDEKKSRGESDEEKPREKKRDDKKGEEKKSGEEPRDEKAAPDPNSPVEPTAKDLASAIEKVKGRIDTCAKENGVSGLVAVRMQVEPGGSIAWSAIREGGDTFQSCVGRVLRDVRLPASQRGGTMVHTITLADP